MTIPRTTKRTTSLISPGEILKEEFLVPLELSGREFGKRLGIPGNRITEIVAGNRRITADTAMRLSKALGTTPEFWHNLQSSYEMDQARAEAENKRSRLNKELRRIERVVIPDGRV